MRQATILTCPVCQKQRPYCGVEEAELGEPRMKMGIDRHLKSHDLSEEEHEDAMVEAILSAETTEVRNAVCEEADSRTWDRYDSLNLL